MSVPGQYSTTDATLTGAVNGANAKFTFSSSPVAVTVAPFLNGLLMTQPQDVSVSGDSFTLTTAQIPETGDVVTARAWVPDVNGVNAPVQYSTVTGSLSGALNGVNNVFVLNLPLSSLGLPVLVTQVSLFWNGLFLTPGVDYTFDGVNTFTLIHDQYPPEPGDTLTAQVYLS